MRDLCEGRVLQPDRAGVIRKHEYNRAPLLGGSGFVRERSAGAGGRLSLRERNMTTNVRRSNA